MNAILVSGSLAYDTIMDFPDLFEHHIIEGKTHMINVSFVVDKMEQQFGGTAGNIAYTLRLLQTEPLLVSTLGSDADTYFSHLKKCEISTDYIAHYTTTKTAQATIMTDKNDNQISAFYPGALVKDVSISKDIIDKKPAFAIIAPNFKDTMLAHVQACVNANIPIIFDPGQQVSALSGQELMRTIGQSSYLIGNDYEIALIEKKTGWTRTQILEHVDHLIITKGEHGSVIYTKEDTYTIAPCTVESVQDPTGAGDAFRAGFFSSLAKQQDFQTCGQVGSVAAAYAIESYGTQNHHFTLEEFSSRYERTYSAPMSKRI